MNYIRIWTEIDTQDVQEHIVIVDDKFGFCPNCKTPGIELKEMKKCPGCDREFKYVTSREAKGARAFEIVMRTRKKLPHMTFVDYDDYDKMTVKKKSDNLFKDI